MQGKVLAELPHLDKVWCSVEYGKPNLGAHHEQFDLILRECGSLDKAHVIVTKTGTGKKGKVPRGGTKTRVVNTIRRSIKDFTGHQADEKVEEMEITFSDAIVYEERFGQNATSTEPTEWTEALTGIPHLRNQLKQIKQEHTRAFLASCATPLINLKNEIAASLAELIESDLVGSPSNPGNPGSGPLASPGSPKHSNANQLVEGLHHSLRKALSMPWAVEQEIQYISTVLRTKQSPLVASQHKCTHLRVRTYNTDPSYTTHTRVQTRKHIISYHYCHYRHHGASVRAVYLRVE